LHVGLVVTCGEYFVNPAHGFTDVRPRVVEGNLQVRSEVADLTRDIMRTEYYTLVWPEAAGKDVDVLAALSEVDPDAESA
jgi:hypothetical protein